MGRDLVCAECSRAVATGDEYLILPSGKKSEKEAILCSECIVKANTSLGEEAADPNILTALAAGLAAAVVAGLIWYYFVTLTDIQFGLVSVLMGWLVGRAVVWGAGNKRGVSLQWLSVGLTAVAIVFSEYLIFNHAFLEVGAPRNLTLGEFFEVYGAYFTEDTGFFDALFFAIALWQAFRTPAPRALSGTVVNPRGN